MTAEDLARLHAVAFPGDRGWSAAELADLRDGPGGFVIADPQGFALGRALAGEAELLTLAVDPQTRRRGLGRALLAGYEDEALRRGAEMTFLEVAQDNVPARALYDGAGYRQIGQRPGYYHRGPASPVAALILAKSLGRR